MKGDGYRFGESEYHPDITVLSGSTVRIGRSPLMVVAGSPARHGGKPAGLSRHEPAKLLLKLLVEPGHGKTLDQNLDALQAEISAPAGVQVFKLGVGAAWCFLESFTVEDWRAGAWARVTAQFMMPNPFWLAATQTARLTASPAVLSGLAPVTDAVFRLDKGDFWFSAFCPISGTAVSGIKAESARFVYIDTVMVRAWSSDSDQAWVYAANYGFAGHVVYPAIGPLEIWPTRGCELRLNLHPECVGKTTIRYTPTSF